MVKTFKNPLLWSLLADAVETWYTILGTSKEYYQVCSNVDTRLTFDIKGQLWFLKHLYGKMLKWWITIEV